MIEREEMGFSFYQYPHLARFPQVFHGHFTRMGGMSHGAFQGSNVSFDVGDREVHVEENRRLVKDIAGTQILVDLTQVHGIGVYIPEDHPGKETGFLSADAIVTARPGLMTMIKTADCQPVFLYDPVRKVVGNIHSGWRGSVANIIGETVRVMKERFNCDPGDLLAGVGPSLGPCCAEFVNYADEIPERYWPYKDDRHHMDFWAVSRDQLVEQGVNPENIVLSRLCTACSNQDLFFSYRRDKLTGRLANVIGLL